MPRPKNTIRRIQINAMIPEDLVAQMKLQLFSEVEGRVPHGAQSDFISQLIAAHFSQKVPRDVE